MADTDLVVQGWVLSSAAFLQFASASQGDTETQKILHKKGHLETPKRPNIQYSCVRKPFTERHVKSMQQEPKPRFEARAFLLQGNSSTMQPKNKFIVLLCFCLWFSIKFYYLRKITLEK